MYSWLALGKALTDRHSPKPCPTPTDMKATGGNDSDVLKF